MKNKHLLVACCGLAILLTLAACNKQNDTPTSNSTATTTTDSTTPPANSAVTTIDNSPVTGPAVPFNPYDEYDATEEELMQRVSAAGQATNFSLACIYDLEVEGTSTILINDGADTLYKHVFYNTIDSNGAHTLAKHTEQYFVASESSMYTKDGDKLVKSDYTFETTPDKLTVQKCVDDIVGTGFLENLTRAINGYTYDIINDQYLLNDFSFAVDGETKMFQKVIIKFNGDALKSMECETGPQKLFFEISDINASTVTVPH